MRVALEDLDPDVLMKRHGVELLVDGFERFLTRVHALPSVSVTRVRPALPDPPLARHVDAEAHEAPR